MRASQCTTHRMSHSSVYDMRHHLGPHKRLASWPAGIQFGMSAAAPGVRALPPKGGGGGGAQGPADHTLAQIKEAIRDGLRAVKNTLDDGAVVPGAGAFEIACAQHLRATTKKARTHSSTGSNHFFITHECSVHFINIKCSLHKRYHLQQLPPPGQQSSRSPPWGGALWLLVPGGL